MRSVVRALPCVPARRDFPPTLQGHSPRQAAMETNRFGQSMSRHWPFHFVPGQQIQNLPLFQTPPDVVQVRIASATLVLADMAKQLRLTPKARPTCLATEGAKACPNTFVPVSSLDLLWWIRVQCEGRVSYWPLSRCLRRWKSSILGCEVAKPLHVSHRQRQLRTSTV